MANYMANNAVHNGSNNPELARSIEKGFPVYLELVSQVERMHRLLLDVIKDEFMRLRIIEINPVQGLLLFNVGSSEVSAGELRQRGYYQGSNVSYNLKKLVESGYMSYQRSDEDKRSVRVQLSEKGTEIHNIIKGLFASHITELMSNNDWALSDCAQLRDMMLILERYWSKRIRYLY